MKAKSIEFFRILFMLQICLWHYNQLNGFMIHGYIAVEFFFILSGYLLYKSYNKITSKSTLDYTINKCKRIIPRIFCAYLLGGILFIDVIVKDPLKVLNDTFCLTSCGILHWGGGGSILFPLWYVSALIIGGGLIYSLLKFNAKLTSNVILPFLILIIYTFILTENHFNFEDWRTISGFHLPLWRGIAGIGLGCILCKFQMIKNFAIEYKYKLYVDFATIISIFVSIIYVFQDTNNDGYLLFIYSILIISSFSKTSIINRLTYHKFWIKMGSITLDMLILHPFIIRLIGYIKHFNPINLNDFCYSILYILLVVSFSYLYHQFYEQYLSKWFKFKLKVS